MITIGFVLIGLGLGLIFGNIGETIILSMVGLIVGAFLYTRMAVYIPLKFNKIIKYIFYVVVGTLIGFLVGVITYNILGATILGLGVSFTTIDMMSFKKSNSQE